MNPKKVAGLIALAVGVLLFDLWFFFGGSEVQADVIDDGEESSFASEILAAVGFGDEQSTSVPWANPEAWPIEQREEPLSGDLSGALMMTRAASVEPLSALPAEPQLTASVPLPSLSVVLWDRVDPVAVLNTRIVQVGDLLDGFRVEGIAPEEVLVSRNGQRHRLPLQAAARNNANAPSSDATGGTAATPSSEVNP